MSEWLERAVEWITSQQPAERTAVWMVGEQLKDLLRAEPHLAELVVQDLERENMGLTVCEKEIKAYADKHKTGNFACVTPAEAEDIIRKFYGLPAGGDSAPPAPRRKQEEKLVELEDYL